MGAKSLKAWLAPALMAAVLLAAVGYNVLAHGRQLPPGPLNEFQLQELTDRMDLVRQHARSDRPLSGPEQAAALAYDLFGQFKKGGFRQYFRNDPDRALQCRASLGTIDPEAARILEEALAVVKPGLSPDLGLASKQLEALPPEAFLPADRAFDAHLGAFARQLFEFCRANELPKAYEK